MPSTAPVPPIESTFGSAEPLSKSRLAGEGPSGRLPLTPDMLREEPSGNLFGLTQNVGMGWSADGARRAPSTSIVSTMGGFASEDGTPDRARLPHGPLGNRAARARSSGDAARERRDSVCRLSAAIRATAGHRAPPGCSTACAYRNDAAIVMRRLIRSLPTASGVLGIATCDKGLPATMLALAGCESSARRHRAWWRDASGDRRRGCGPGPEPRARASHTI